MQKGGVRFLETQELGNTGDGTRYPTPLELILLVEGGINPFQEPTEVSPEREEINVSGDPRVHRGGMRERQQAKTAKTTRRMMREIQRTSMSVVFLLLASTLVTFQQAYNQIDLIPAGTARRDALRLTKRKAKSLPRVTAYATAS